MAIFSSKKKRDTTALNASAGSNDKPSPVNGQGAFPRSSSAGNLSTSAASSQQQSGSKPFANDKPGPSGILTPSGSTGAGTGNRQSTVVYPWSQRQINYTPSSVFARSDTHDGPSQQVQGPMSPPAFPRYGHSVNPTASSSTGELYVFGGLVQNVVRNDLYVVNCTSSTGPSVPISVNLVETRGEIPPPRVGHASVAVGNVLIVWGGDTKTHPEDAQDDALYLLNLSSKEWTRVKTVGPAPEGRYGHAATIVGSKFYVFGGQKDDGSFMNDLVAFDLQKLKLGKPGWSEVAVSPDSRLPPKRTGHTIVTHGDNIYIFGGTDGQFHYNDTWCFDTSTGVWSELSCIGYIPVPREGHSATLVDDVMYVFGGRGVDGKDLEDLAAFKLSARRWYMFQNMGPAPSGRSGHALATWKNKVYVLGGESYTSARADDPAYMHVLDTSKIRYPPDNKSGSIARKASVPVMSSSHSSHPNGISDLRNGPPASRSEAALPEPPANANAADRRALSPTGSSRSPQAGTSSSADQGTRSRPVSPPQKSPREDGRPRSPEESARGQGIDARLAGDSLQQAVAHHDRALSPTGSIRQRAASPTGSLVQASSSFGQLHSAPATSARTTESLSNRAVSPEAGGSTYNMAPDQAPREDFNPNQLPAPSLKTATQSSAHEAWLKEALAAAIAKGFVPENPPAGLDLSPTARSADAGAALEIKKELAQLKSALVEQAQSTNDRIMSISASRKAALQEASYYRAKLSAFESGSTQDFSTIERERQSDLERKLAEATSARTSLQDRVRQLEADLQHHVAARAGLEERCNAAVMRADAADKNYARSLSDHAELQRRVQTHEKAISDHTERSTTLGSTNQQLQAENADLKERLQTLEEELDHHVKAFDLTQQALLAATTRSDEVHGLWERSTSELATHRDRASQLESDLSHREKALRDLQAKHDDLDRLHRALQAEHHATKALASGGLADLLASRSHSRNRSISSSDQHEERVKAAEEELSSLRDMHQQAKASAETSSAQLAEALQREASLQAQVADLQSEISQLRKSLHQALDDVRTHQSIAAQRQTDARESSRARDAAEVKAGLLKNLLADHGLTPVNDLDTKPNSLPEDATPEQLHGRIKELEARLDQRLRAHGDLEKSAEQAKNDASEYERRYREAARQHQSTLEQLDQTKLDLQKRLVESPRAAQQAEEASNAGSELHALQVRHRQLEQTHMKAVQYVKGTEKMLRRMKEELLRYKERNEELEAQMATGGSGSSHELDNLRRQVQELSQRSDKSSRENDELQRRIGAMHSEHERRFGESSSQARELQGQVRLLKQELQKANHELEETLAVNNSLNQELTAALNHPSSPRATSNGTVETRKLEQEMLQAQNKAEWLRRENQALEQRCQVAEQKISILLDHIHDDRAPASQEQ